MRRTRSLPHGRATAELDPGREEALLTFEESATLNLDYAAELVEGRLVEMSRDNPIHSRLVLKLSSRRYMIHLL